jgi:hypothetical protein
MNQYPNDNATGGQWNAYCEMAISHEDYLERLARVPYHLQTDVIRHCQTVAALRELNNRRIDHRHTRRKRSGHTDMRWTGG